MNNIEAKLFSAELRDDLPSLDLHGLFPQEALEKLELFLFENQRDHFSCKSKDFLKAIRIIYGGGTGVLKTKVLEYLKNHLLVDTIKDEGGSCIVLVYSQ